MKELTIIIFTHELSKALTFFANIILLVCPFTKFMQQGILNERKFRRWYEVIKLVE